MQTYFSENEKTEEYMQEGRGYYSYIFTTIINMYTKLYVDMYAILLVNANTGLLVCMFTNLYVYLCACLQKMVFFPSYHIYQNSIL